MHALTVLSVMIKVICMFHQIIYRKSAIMCSSPSKIIFDLMYLLLVML